MTWTDEKPRPAGRDREAEGAESEGGDLFDAPPREAPWTGLVAAAPDVTEGRPLPEADDLLKGLNEAQREACLHGSGPLLILAGPGSGKTRVITTRIAHLITARGVDPREILAITFTNKAAREMRERVEGTLGSLSGLWISTFHSMCARILRRDIEALGSYTRDFSIFDTSDRNALLKKLIKELGYDPQRFRPAAVGAWISHRKNTDVLGWELELEAGEPDSGMDDEVHARVLVRYQEAMQTQNALDFDDLLLKVLELFDTQLGVRDSYARRFRYVMVDEYQDTNRVQYRLVQHLASHHGNLAVCGDPDQSIYGWRGADIRNILDFEADHPDPVTVRLEQNYRSTGTILAAASAVIANNGERKEKDLWTEGDDGELLVVVECGDENDEAREIAMQIKSLEARGHNFSEVAIFYRVNFMQRALESALRLARVPYQVVAGLEFYARREIRDLVSYLRLMVNPADGAAFTRVVNSPTRGVGATSLGRLGAWASDHGSSMLEACRSEDALGQIRGRARKALPAFAALLESLGDAREGPAAVALDRVLKVIEPDRWMREMDDGSGTADRASNVEELCSFAAEYDLLQPAGGLRGFLENVALVSDADAPDAETDDTGAVKLMTLHACKGLEFPFVFVAGLEDELLPHVRATDEDPEGGLEEERRLLYVGMTRARERLFLTHAAVRTVFGSDHWQRPSPFLSEIPTDLVEGGMAAGESRTDFNDVSEGLGEYAPEGDELQLTVGARVEHAHFGPGRVMQLSGAGINARATVDFAHHGRKELLLQYANLERLPGMSDENPSMDELVARLESLVTEARTSGLGSELAPILLRLAEEASRDTKTSVADEIPIRFGMVGDSPAMRRVFVLLEKVAPSDVSVLIQGETGTGKELIARALHEYGSRREAPMLSENCAAVPANLLESELFGHKKGSFTGAVQDRKGHFVYADGGTVFLDEIGDMPLEMQAKLLRVLQDGEVRPVGGNKTYKVDVRVVGATNKDLAAMCREGTFREDLYYRLNVITIQLPPLRERTGDVAHLVHFYLQRIGEEMGREASVTPEALAALEAWRWPGNVRELENELRRAMALSTGPIGLEDLSPNVTSGG